VPPRIDVVGLVVRDLDASLAFYRRLGLDIPENPDPEGHGHVEATLPGGLRIAWDTYEVIRSFDPEWSEPSGPPGMSLAFRVDSPAEVDELYSELVGSGYDGHLKPFDAFWGQRYATLRDPDGNPVDLFAPLEGA
jgi:catechol 2,3-dioxygenase-like lactoylglutathione lyase family enzyme